jgi:hypothetical protein
MSLDLDTFNENGRLEENIIHHHHYKLKSSIIDSTLMVRCNKLKSHTEITSHYTTVCTPLHNLNKVTVK